jgi:predicted KAP-like P-loop ATPase
MFKPDQPITTRSEDILGRYPFAKTLGDAILKYEQKESLVVGLYGPWGSGKTSIINMAMEHVEKADIENKPIVLNFNPWNYSDQNQLIAQFFKELAIELSLKDKNKGFENAAKLLDLYSTAITPLIIIPNPSSPLALGEAAICKASSGVLRFFAKSKIKSLREIKNELNEILQKQNRKIVIIIDDIDRLNNIETRQIFQLVKSLADFKNTIYILAFDKNVVFEALKEVQKGDGYEYLGKVVQVPFAIPVISTFKVRQFLSNSLGDVTKDLPEDKFDKRYWENIFYSGTWIFFKTIRDVNRLVNIFRFNFFLLKDDVNVIDLIAITAIQVFLPGLYSEINEHKAIFLEGYKDSSHGQDKKQYLVKTLDEIIEKNARGYPIEKIKNLLVELFPKLNSIYGNLFHGNTSDLKWRKDGRICSENNFDIFFQLNTLSGQISKSEVEKIISKAENYKDFYEALELLNEQGKISEFLERLLDYSEELSQNKIQNIITTLMDQGDNYPEDDTDMLGFDNMLRMDRINYFYTKNLHDQNKCFEIYKNAISTTNHSIRTIVDAIGGLGYDHGKGTKDDPMPEEERRINKEQLETLEKLACQKIEKWAKEGRLIKHRYLTRILYDWEGWAGKKTVKDYIQKAIDTDEGLLDFIERFPRQVRTQGLGDYGWTIKYEVRLDEITHFAELEKIVPRLREILLSEKFKDLSKDQQKAVKLVLDTYDGKFKSKF